MTWLTPEQLAAELRPDATPEVGAGWVRDRMASGEIPSIKVGSKRYFTPECRAEMVRRAMDREKQETEPDGWGQVTRGGTSS